MFIVIYVHCCNENTKLSLSFEISVPTETFYTQSDSEGNRD